MEKDIANKKGTRKIRSKTELNKIIGLILIVLVILIIIDRIQQQPNSKDKISLIVDNEDVTEKLENDILILNDSVYMSYNDVKNILDKTIYIENDSNLIITTSEKKVAALETDNGSTEIEINGSKTEIKNSVLISKEDNNTYIPISEMGNVYDIEFAYIENTKNIVINSYSKELKKANAKSKISLKNGKNIFSQTIANIQKGEEVFIVSVEEKWTKIRTQQGYIGYVKSEQIENIITVRENMIHEEKDNSIEAIEIDVTGENIKTYRDRKILANKILTEAVKAEKKLVKIKNENNTDSMKRFKIESEPLLKECGIYVRFE